jgi:hypothetical protein
MDQVYMAHQQPRAGQACSARQMFTDPVVTERGARVAAVGAVAFGALALGAAAIGALAIGRLVVGALALGRGHVRALVVDELHVGRLHIRELAADTRAPEGSTAQTTGAGEITTDALQRSRLRRAISDTASSFRRAWGPNRRVRRTAETDWDKAVS